MNNEQFENLTIPLFQAHQAFDIAELKWLKFSNQATKKILPNSMLK